MLDRRAITANGNERVREFDIRPPDATLPAGALSGGNQQKIVIAREMGREFSVLLASQPTRGVDVGAIEFIHARIRAAAAAGRGVLLVSADLVEVLALAHRVAVMYEGQFVCDFPCWKVTTEILGPYMTGPRRPREGSRMSRTTDAGSLATTWLAPLVAILIAAIVGDILILSFGQAPGEVYRLLIEGTWQNPYGMGQVFYKATTLTFTGLAVALGLRAGLFNIGAEGQLAAGGFAAAMAGLLVPARDSGDARRARSV